MADDSKKYVIVYEDKTCVIAKMEPTESNPSPELEYFELCTDLFGNPYRHHVDNYSASSGHLIEVIANQQSKIDGLRKLNETLTAVAYDDRKANH